MLNYKLLERKLKIKKDENNQYYDLLSKTFNEKMTFVPRTIVVNKYYVARPDLLSLALYGDDKYADIICKINGISNPFELNEDDIITVPDTEYLTECLYKSKEGSGLIKDAKTETIQKIDKNNRQKRISDSRSPNEQIIGDANFIIDKSMGIVFY
jgi:hypothetical protein